MQTQTVKDLQKELKKARDDLKSDEDIFAEKAKEVIALKSRLEELVCGHLRPQDTFDMSSVAKKWSLCHLWTVKLQISLSICTV